MRRNHMLIGLGAVAGAAVAAVVIMQRRHDRQGRTPDWTDPHQPPEGTGGQPANALPMMPSPSASWHAVRPGSPRMSAGSVVMRHYAPTLVDDPESLVR